MSNVVHPTYPMDPPPPYDAGGAGDGKVTAGPDDSAGQNRNIIMQSNVTFINSTAPQPAVATAVIPTYLGHYPCIATCPYCHSTVMTDVSYRVGCYTWIIVLILFLLGFFLCCLIPFCVPAAKDAVHTCPNCGNTIGVNKKC